MTFWKTWDLARATEGNFRKEMKRDPILITCYEGNPRNQRIPKMKGEFFHQLHLNQNFGGAQAVSHQKVAKEL